MCIRRKTKIPVFPLTRPTLCQPPTLVVLSVNKKKLQRTTIRNFRFCDFSLEVCVKIVIWARDDQITFFFAVAVVDLPHVCVELALLFLHRCFDNNFEDIIKSLLHLFAVQS